MNFSTFFLSFFLFCVITWRRQRIFWQSVHFWTLFEMKVWKIYECQLFWAILNATTSLFFSEMLCRSLCYRFFEPKIKSTRLIYQLDYFADAKELCIFNCVLTSLRTFPLKKIDIYRLEKRKSKNQTKKEMFEKWESRWTKIKWY